MRRRHSRKLRTARSAAVRGRPLVSVLLISVFLWSGCRANRPKLTVPPATGTHREHDFLLWKIEDAGAARAKVQMCIEKHVNSDLAALCEQALHVRELESEIATRYLSLLYGERAPAAAHQHSRPLASLEGSKFESRFLKQMIKQDGEGLERARSCLTEATHPEILNFCHLVERSRSVEIQLLENQLCQLQKNCRSKLSK